MLFPNGKFIGQDKYAALIQSRFDITVADFEDSVKHDIAMRRLESLITAGVTVGDKEVRDLYRKNNIKIKFDYAVISSDDLSKQINPSDADLEAFFKKNAARYATAVPEQRTITYFAFTPNDVPGGVPQPTQQEIQQYYTAHQSEYSVPEQARARHILIKVDQGADAKTDAAAKAKAEEILKQIQGGANFADLAKKNSDDPGSKDTGGELGFAQRGRMVPEFDNAIFTQKIGDTKIIKTQYGYHIVQVEERQPAHSQIAERSASDHPGHTDPPEVLRRAGELCASADLGGHQERPREDRRRTSLATGHHASCCRAGHRLPDCPTAQALLTKAFQSKQGDPAQSAPTGEGYAIFQVTGITAAHAPTFADWKSHVLDDYRAEQLPALLRQKTTDLATQAQATNDLAKAAKAVGATVKTSDLVGETGQVPQLGEVGQVAPQLFDLAPGNISGPINAGRTGVVAKILDKQEPSADDITKNFDQARDQLLDQRAKRGLPGLRQQHHRRLQETQTRSVSTPSRKTHKYQANKSHVRRPIQPRGPAFRYRSAGL